MRIRNNFRTTRPKILDYQRNIFNAPQAKVATFITFFQGSTDVGGLRRIIFRRINNGLLNIFFPRMFIVFFSRPIPIHFRINKGGVFQNTHPLPPPPSPNPSTLIALSINYCHNACFFHAFPREHLM